MRMNRHYTPEEIQFVKKNIRGISYVEMTKLFNERFGLRITLKQMKKLTHYHGIRNYTGSYNGGAPQNKGKKHKPWQGNYRPIGSERVLQYSSGREYADVKIGHRTWVRKHVLIWEQANGKKVPKGHVVIFADGNSRNFTLDNLLLVSKAELAVMNSFKSVSPRAEVTRTGKTLADLKMAIAARKRQAKQKTQTRRKTS